MDPIIDEKLAKFVVNSHYKSHPEYHTTSLHDATEGKWLVGVYYTLTFILEYRRE